MVATKHTEIANLLRKEILSGRYGTEGGLPSFSELAKRYGIATNTVTNALVSLTAQGILEKRGNSYYVNQLPIVMTEYVPSIITRLPKSGGYYTNIGDVEKVFLPEHIAEKFKLPAQIAIFRTQVSGEISNGDKKPLQISHRYHLIELSDEQIRHMQDDAEYDPLWNEEKYAVTLFSIDEVVPRLATEEERRTLNLPENTPVTYLFETIKQDETIIMVQEVIISPRETLIFAFPFTNKP
jgi:DNA-binding GntR family transcriptional regulator